METLDVTGGIVRFDAFTSFADSGEGIVVESALRFRTEDELRASLAAAGFVEPRICGDWEGSPVGATSPELIVVAGRGPDQRIVPGRDVQPGGFSG